MLSWIDNEVCRIDYEAGSEFEVHGINFKIHVSQKTTGNYIGPVPITNDIAGLLMHDFIGLRFRGMPFCVSFFADPFLTDAKAYSLLLPLFKRRYSGSDKFLEIVSPQVSRPNYVVESASRGGLDIPWVWSETIKVPYGVDYSSKNASGVRLSQILKYVKEESVQEEPNIEKIEVSTALVGGLIRYRKTANAGKVIVGSDGKKWEVSLINSIEEMSLRNDPDLALMIRRAFLPDFSFVSTEIYEKREHYDASTLDDHINELLPIVLSLKGKTILAPGDGVGVVSRLCPGAICGQDGIGETVFDLNIDAGKNTNVWLISYSWFLFSQDARDFILSTGYPIVIYDVYGPEGFVRHGPRVWSTGLDLPSSGGPVPRPNLLFTENLLRQQLIFPNDSSYYAQYYSLMRPVSKDTGGKVFAETVDDVLRLLEEVDEVYFAFIGKTVSKHDIRKAEAECFFGKLECRVVYEKTGTGLKLNFTEGVFQSSDERFFCKSEEGVARCKGVSFFEVFFSEMVPNRAHHTYWTLTPPPSLLRYDLWKDPQPKSEDHIYFEKGFYYVVKSGEVLAGTFTSVEHAAQSLDVTEPSVAASIWYWSRHAALMALSQTKRGEPTKVRRKKQKGRRN